MCFLARGHLIVYAVSLLKYILTKFYQEELTRHTQNVRHARGQLITLFKRNKIGNNWRKQQQQQNLF